MVKIDLDGKEYDLDALSNEAKKQLTAIQFCDAELRQLQAEVATIQTARLAYVNDLKGELAKLDGKAVAVAAPEIKLEQVPEAKVEPAVPLAEASPPHLTELIEQPFIDLSGRPSFVETDKTPKKGRLLGRLFKK